MPYETEPARSDLGSRLVTGAILFMIIGSATLGYFFWDNGQGPEVNSVEVILIIGVLILAFISIGKMVIARLEAETPTLETASGPFRLANPEGIAVLVEPTEVSIEWLTASGVAVPSGVNKTVDGKRIVTNSGASAQGVTLRVYLLGGVKKKAWWIGTEGGELGALIVWGDGEIIPISHAGGTSLVLPRTLIRVLPSAVSPQVVAILKDPRYQGRFVYGKSPIYRPGSPSPEFDRWLGYNRGWVQERISITDPNTPQQSREDVYNLITRNLLLQASENSLARQVESQSKEIANLQAENEAITRNRASVAGYFSGRSPAEQHADAVRGMSYESSGGGGRA